jgi:Uma2 family endonuclease
MYELQFPRLPTMYDLPSEDPEEPGLPDQYHSFQPSFLRETCKPTTYSASDFFIAADLNLYYDRHHTQWHKRPDWFLATGVKPAKRQEELKLSYVMWYEYESPLLVVELLSPGTEGEDLGQNLREIGQPPTKWEVYERILRVPFYVVYDRHNEHLRVFILQGTKYQEVTIEPTNPRFWIEELGLGLGLWQGRYQGIEGKWLRWYNVNEDWILTATEERQLTQAQSETLRSAREAAEAKLTSAIPQLLSLGLTTEQIANSLGLTIAQVEAAIE